MCTVSICIPQNKALEQSQASSQESKEELSKDTHAVANEECVVNEDSVLEDVQPTAIQSTFVEASVVDNLQSHESDEDIEVDIDGSDSEEYHKPLIPGK